MIRSEFAATAVLAVCVGAFFAPALFGDAAVFTWNMDVWLPWAASASSEDLARPTRLADCARQFAVMRGLATDALQDGRIPLWNRWIYSGTPFLANFQPGVFYPPNLLLAFSGLSVPGQMTAYMAFHLLLGTCGVYALLRVWRVRPLAALAGAIVFGWSGYNASRTGIPTMVATGAWLPWALAASHRWFRRHGAGAWMGMAASLGMAGLAGFAQIFVFTAYAWGWYGVVHALSLRPRWNARRWLGWAAAGAVGVLLTCVQLVPTLEFMGQAQDAANPPEMLASGTLHPWVLGKLVAPELLGHPVEATNATPLLKVGNGYYHQTERSTAIYVGLLPLLLLGAVLLSPGDHRREALAALGLALLGFLFCFRTPLTALAAHLPGLAFSRPDRATFLWCTGMALVAGIGADRLASREGPSAHRVSNQLSILIGAMAVVFAVTMAIAGHRILPGRVASFLGAELIHRAAFLGLVTAVVATGLIFLRVAGVLGARAFLALAVVLLAADLGWYAQRRNLLQPEESIYRPPRPGGSLKFLQQQRRIEGPFRILTYEPRGGRAVLPPSTAALYGLEDALGFDSVNLARYRELMEAIDPAIVIKRGNFRGATRPEAVTSPLVDLLNVRYVLSGSSDPLPELARAHASDLVVHRNPEALPRAFLVGEVRVEEDPARTLAAMAHPSFRPDLWAYSEVPIEGTGSRAGGTASPGTARLARHEDERVEVEVQAASPALLVLTDAYYPGWKASVDGRERPIHRVDHVFRGVVVQPGERLVLFEYRPASFRIGAGLALSGLAGLGLGALTLRLTRRRPRRTETA